MSKSHRLVSCFVIATVSVLCVFGQNFVEIVPKYDAENFKKIVPEKNHFVLFFAPWNGESKNVAAVWEELALKEEDKKSTDIQFAKVDCTTESELCEYHDVSAYPTVKLYKTGGDELGIRYRGVHDLQSLEQFLNKNLGRDAEFVWGARVATMPEPVNGLHQLQDENFDDAIASVVNAFVKFCTPWSSKCMDLNPIWAKLAKEFRYEDDLILGSVDCSLSKTTCNDNEVRGYPTLLWIKEGMVVEKYPTTQRDFDSLKKYIQQKTGKQEPRKVPKDVEEEEEPSDVISIGNHEVKDVIAREPLLFVQYWTAWCSDCMAFDTAWETLGAMYNGYEDPEDQKIKIAKFDCALHRKTCEELKVEDFPTLNLYKKGKLIKTYVGPLKLENVNNFIKGAIDEKVEL